MCGENFKSMKRKKLGLYGTIIGLYITLIYFKRLIKSDIKLSWDIWRARKTITTIG
jgi:multisubunit Na+/H+ antiporter MnhE subunit